MRNFSKIFDDMFEITDVQKFEFTSNARNLKEMFENASMRLNVQRFAPSLNAKNSKKMFKSVSTKSSAQRFEFLKSIKNFQKMLENAFLKLNVHVNAFIWQESFEKSLMQDNQKTSLWTNLVFQLTDIQVVVLKKKIKDLFKRAYDESMRFIKCFIKEFQNKNSFVQQFKLNDVEHVNSRRRRANDWTINFKNLIKHENKLFILENLMIRKKLICRNHDDSLIEHFDAEKTLKLFQRKYYWLVCEKQIKEYVRFCNICQRTKILHYKSYEKLNSLLALKKS